MLHCSDRTDAATDSDTAVLTRLAATIHDRRTVLGVSQRELATRAGVDRTFLSGVESGKRNPTIAMLGKLAIGLETTVAALTAHL